MNATKCAYCKEKAIGHDAIGLPVCKKHLGEADNYVSANSTKGKDAATNGENRWPIEDIPDEWDLDIF